MTTCLVVARITYSAALTFMQREHLPPKAYLAALGVQLGKSGHPGGV